MEFREFCNICFAQDNIIKIYSEESEQIKNILISLIGHEEIVHESIIYLCLSCCNKLEEINKFREMCITNFIQFRLSYQKFKRKLELHNDPDLKKKIKLFIDTKVFKRKDTINLRDSENFSNEVDEDIEQVFIKEEPDEFVTENENVFDYEVENENDIFWEAKNLEHKLHTEIELDNNCLEEGTPETNTNFGKIEYNELFSSGRNNIRTTETKLLKLPVELKTIPVFPVQFETNSYKCKVCSKIFSQVFELKNHEIVHEKPYTCNVCNKSFTQSCNLKRHELIHIGEKPHICNICKKTFSQSGNLRRHQLVHMKEKIYTCNVCKQTFWMLQDLRNHRVIHTDKPHVCKICEKVFADVRTLKRHNVIHKGEKPHKCSICTQAFSRLDNLKRHKRCHTGTKPHKCHICTKKFADASNLKRHMRLHESVLTQT